MVCWLWSSQAEFQPELQDFLTCLLELDIEAVVHVLRSLAYFVAFKRGFIKENVYIPHINVLKKVLLLYQYLHLDM